MKLIPALTAVFLLFPCGLLRAEDGLSYYFRGGLSFLQNSTSMPAIPGNFLCGEYTEGKATGFYAGFGVQYALYKDLLFADAGLLFESRPVDLRAFSECYQVFDPQAGDYVDLYQQHDFSAGLNYLMIDGGISAMPLRNIAPVKLRLGFDAGNPLFVTDFSNRQSILEPSTVNYPTGGRENTVDEGKISTAGTAIGASASLMYEFAIDEEFTAAAEITYRKGLNSVLSDYKFDTDIIRAGIRIYYSPAEKEAPLPVRDSVPADTARPPVVASLPSKEDYVTGFSDKNTRVLETVVTQTYPLLNYIFFDSASAVLKEKFRNSEPTVLFDEKKLPKSTLGIYYRILDIIGSRMRSNPAYKITLAGVTDGIEAADKDTRLALASQRAQSVASYLKGRWGIESGRISLDSREMPAVPTSVQYDEGYQENRRVEIYSDDNELLQPVSHTRFMEYAPDDSLHRFDISLRAHENIKSVILNLKRDGKVVLSKILAPSGQFAYDIVLDNGLLGELLEQEGSFLSAELSVTDKDYRTETKEIALDITREKNNFEIGRLNLIVFDFDRAEISKTNKTMIKNFVSSSLRKNSETVITGSTDRLGEAAYNNRLSSERAAAVESYIRNFLPDYVFKEVKGTGSSVLPYDNSLPEGRFYCRTVLIEVKTPVTK